MHGVKPRNVIVVALGLTNPKKGPQYRTHGLQKASLAGAGFFKVIEGIH
jgi:hypothetical protein